MKKLFTFMSLALVSLTFGQEEATFNVSGSVDAYFRANLNADNTGDPSTVLGTGDYSIFNDDSGFSAGLANVTFSYGGETVGFVADFAYGPRMDDWNDEGVVNEAYMYWNASDKVMLMMGRFNSWMGYERLSAANNFHYSMSHMFSYSARNFNGLVAQFDLGTDLRGGIGVMNQVNDLDGNTGKFSVAAGLTYKETTSLSFASSDEQSFIDFKTAFDVSDNFNVKLNAHIADFGDDGFDLGESFTSISAYPQIKSSDKMSWGMRLEYMMIDNAITGDDLNVITPTLTARYSVGDLTIIPELRLDSASEDIFIDSDGELAGGLTAFNLGAVYTF